MTVHNRKDTTLKCIERFYNCHGIEKYIIDFYMMDDGSTDGTSDAVHKEYSQIKILHGDGNLFWNRGMYYCWKEAAKIEHDFYIWLNDDTMLFDNALEILFADYEKAGKMSIISGCCCDVETKSKVTYGGRIQKKLIIPNGEIQRIKDINGNFVLIPNCVFKNIGFNDPYFQHMLGDLEYANRAIKNKINVFISSFFIATCNRHNDSRKCYDGNIGLFNRLKFLYSPFAPYPTESFYFFWKQNLYLRAFASVFSCHLRTFFPKIYNK